ncbi:DUF262 domain-containing protein [Propionibacterium freudenreichii]|uniref:DUF262 domain-containing protein n=1 Tax=Propionibacterium freudenreichii TaxID=1744 RepID=UPI0009B8CA73|nr:DUF262 domain-containing protein [Propionibacterium freudenreichii]
MKDVIDLNPPYQRESNVWSKNTQSVLIDSIINGFDVPKLYFEEERARRLTPDGLTYQYAVIDGKQRLEAILAFLDDSLPLEDDFVYFEDESVNARGMKLSSLASEYPVLAGKFLDFELPIVRVTSDSGDLIEEMFQRLNASTALNSAERRNSVSGPTREAANELAKHSLLTSRSPIKNARYKYRELAAKFLAIEYQMDTFGKVTDTKAKTLYDLFLATRGASPKLSEDRMIGYKMMATSTLDRMLDSFEENDRLLASIGTVVVYYISFRSEKFSRSVSRDALLEFEKVRQSVRERMWDDGPSGKGANGRFAEYNALVQSTNDGTALSRRSEILSTFVMGYKSGNSLAALNEMAEGESPEMDESDEQ